MSEKEENFGAFLKRFRLQSNYGLRRFADLIGIKASNLCDIEHSRRNMPKDHLELTADTLGLEKGSSDWEKFFKLACRGDDLPADVQKIAGRRLMPALLRTVDNVQLSDEDIRRLIEDIQGRNKANDGGR